jgi:hypothetical protein
MFPHRSLTPFPLVLTSSIQILPNLHKKNLTCVMNRVLLSRGCLCAITDLLENHFVEMMDTIVDFLELLSPALQH